MSTFILSIILVLVFIFFMAIGLILSNKTLKGSCGDACECSDLQKKICPIQNIKKIKSH